MSSLSDHKWLGVFDYQIEDFASFTSSLKFVSRGVISIRAKSHLPFHAKSGSAKKTLSSGPKLEASHSLEA